jgi:hypothetical protein
MQEADPFPFPEKLVELYYTGSLGHLALAGEQLTDPGFNRPWVLEMA